MRYRAFGQTGRSLSALTLRLPQTLSGEAGVALIYAALEVGINAFELRDPTNEASRTLGEALASLERRLAVVMLRIGGGEARGGVRGLRDFSRRAITGAVEDALTWGRFGRLDAVLLDAPQAQEIHPDTLETLLAMRGAGRTVMIGLSGESAVVQKVMASTEEEASFDLLGATYNLRSGWPQRNLIKRAFDRGMMVVGERFQPESLAALGAPPRPRRFLGLGLGTTTARPKKSRAYDFLHQTSGWRSDELCLAYAMTEPTVSTVIVEASDSQEFARLAAVTERELPTGIPAQIEMARVLDGE